MDLVEGSVQPWAALFGVNPIHGLTAVNPERNAGLPLVNVITPYRTKMRHVWGMVCSRDCEKAHPEETHPVRWGFNAVRLRPLQPVT
jgi:hypothetical protein